MNKYTYKVRYSSQFKKNIKKITKQGKDIDILLDIIDKIANCEELDSSYNNHKLKDDKYFKNCWECHLGTTRSDWLLIYQYDDENLTIIMVNTGSHSELFGK